MRILAIETSCDETGIALVEGTKIEGGFAFAVLKSALLSQALLHSPYGGVYPNLAKREHLKNLPLLFEQFKNEQFDAIAVTRGPGLEPALWTGIEFAKKLASERGLPLLPVNHMEGHLLSSLARRSLGEGGTRTIQEVKLPVLALLISGGHTEFVLMRNWFEYEIVGQTLDDAVGEAFDKVARMLSLPYPGGPEISKLAEQNRTAHGQSAKQVEGGLSTASSASADPELSKFSAENLSTPRDFVLHGVHLPRPMLTSKDCDVSFSGLKTAVLYALRDKGGIQKLSSDEIAAFAEEFEDAVTDVLVHKTKRALEQTGAQTFVIGGGVAANSHIRTTLQTMVAEQFTEVEMRLPELNITGDNAIMIAEAALARALSGSKDDIDPSKNEEIVAKGNLSIQNT